jgi:signal transduction histidine kinase/DNA-binding response OmpR family regulator/ligand-binding sensor domain-containing protein
MPKICKILLLQLLLPLLVVSQNASFQLYTTTDGLTRNTIIGIAQDNNGFLWVNTANGLNRFDGRQFLNYNNAGHVAFAKTRPTGNIAAKGDLLYLYENWHVLVLNTVTGVMTKISLAEITAGKKNNLIVRLGKLPNGEIVAFVLDTDQQSSSLVRLDENGIRRVDVLPADVLSHLLKYAANSRGDFFCFAGSSLLKCTGDGSTGRLLQRRNGEISNFLAVGQNNTIFVLDRSILSVLKEGADSIQPHPVSRHLRSTLLSSLLETPTGDLWISALDKHLYFYDAAADQLIDFKPQLEKIFPTAADFDDIFQDDAGTIWVESDLGLLKVTPRQPLFSTFYTDKYDVCQGQCSFRGFAEDEKGKVYVSFYSNICKIDENGPGAPMPLLKSTHTPFGILCHEGMIILNDGTALDPASGKKTNPFNSEAYAFDLGVLEKDSNGRLWWGWGWKFYCLETKDGRSHWKPVGLIPGKHINSLKFDPVHQWLWLGHQEGIAAFDPSTGKLALDGETSGFPVERVHHLHPDGKGGVWVGAEQGLFHFDPDGKVCKKYAKADGLPDNFVNGIQPEGDSCLWVATNHGLSRFSIATGRFINFYEEDGLASNEFNRASSFRASDGRLYFGGMRGITAFYPQEVLKKYEHRRVPGKLALLSVSMTDDEQDTIRTDYFSAKEPRLEVFFRNKTVTIEFGLLDFQNPGATQYSYLLDGHNNAWSNPAINNTVTYSSLPAGDYVFRVKALNAKGQWIPDELTVRIIVHPPVWATWWANALYVSALAGLGFAIFSFLKKRWALKNQLQNEQREALRLKELDVFKSRLYTNLTHEFRTPLTVILGMTEQVKSSLNGHAEKLQPNLELIERNGLSLLRLVNQLLDLSKLEDGSLKLRLQHGNVVSFLRYLCESLKSYAENKCLSLRFSSKMETLDLDFDPEQLQQVMTNLLSNAIKFTPDGGNIEVKTELKEESAKERRGASSEEIFHPSAIVITVSDTGIGIAESELPHIFDRFYQADGSNTRESEGTGIGLAHTLELVKLMGGHIRVESERGKGSVFTVSLPVRRREDVPVFSLNKLPKNSLPLAGDTALVFENNANKTAAELPQLLIVEDNPDLVIYLKNCLEGLYEIEVANNGNTGIEKAIESIPDLVLSDVMMPEKDGFELVETLKNDERTSHIPIVLLTAKADVESKIAGLRRGADAYLFKPFQKTELLATLEMMMENRRRLQAHFSKTMPVAPRAVAASSAMAEIEVLTVEEEEETILLQDAFLQKLRGIVEENFADENFALPRLCDILGMTRFQLFRKMKAVSDETPANFIRNFRMEKAKAFFETTDMNVSEVAWAVGFKDLAHFSKTFQEYYGSPPSEWRRI